MRFFGLLVLSAMISCAPAKRPTEFSSPATPSAPANSQAATNAIEQETTAIERATTSQLWSDYRFSTDRRKVALAEAELATRGEYKSNGAYIGMRRDVYAGRYARTSEFSVDRNCSDFASAAAAQRFFIVAGGPERDPHGLDRDGDGSACEWGTEVTSSIARYKPAPVTRPRSVSRSRCYVGPRGGTYTITASGRKNYNGC